MEGYKPPPPEFLTAASALSYEIVKRLYEVGWGEGEDRVDVYTVNVPVRRSSERPLGSKARQR